MREILFRGKTVQGEWIEGFLTHYCNAWYIVYQGGPRVGYEVIPETIGQYTGLIDKNGKKIFEGDIVRCRYANVLKNEHIQTVVFYCGKFMAKFSNGGAYAELFDGVKHFDFDKSVYMTEIEIIGNIHDNSELLKEDNNA